MKTFERISRIFSLEKNKFFIYIICFFSSLLDLLSIGLIAPLITSLLDPELFGEYISFYYQIYFY